jgi:hypothetical protein
MSNRITKAMVQTRVDAINRRLGFDPETITHRSVGAIHLGAAYGGYRVERLCNDAGGITTLQYNYAPLREAYNFLNGMIVGMTCLTF